MTLAAFVVTNAGCRHNAPALDADAGPLTTGSAEHPRAAVDAATPLPTATTDGSRADRSPGSAIPPASVPAFDPCTNESAPVRGKSVGHTSLVFKLDLADGSRIIWKANAADVRGRYKGEIAAYRLAVALGLDNVLPACARAFPRDVIAGAVASSADGSKLLAREAIAAEGTIRGASIAWFEHLAFWPVEKDPLRSEARGWLVAGAGIPPTKTDLARQLSTLVAFDYLTGNWDRYSGGNVGLDEAHDRVLYIDNDAAFMEGTSKDATAKSRALLLSTDRFSRAFVGAVRALDARRLDEVLGDEYAGHPLLTKRVVASVLERARDLVAVIDAKIAKRGEADTLYFR